MEFVPDEEKRLHRHKQALEAKRLGMDARQLARHCGGVHLHSLALEEHLRGILKAKEEIDAKHLRGALADGCVCGLCEAAREGAVVKR